MSHSLSLSYSTSKSVCEKKEGTRHSRKIRNFIRKLQAVECPYLDGMNEPLVSEVMFTPGEARIRILTWLTRRIHPSLQTLLSFESSATISSIPKLASLLCDLGLCAREDYEIVKGTTPTSKQLLFLEALVDMVTLAGPEDRDCSLKDKMKRSSPLDERKRCGSEWQLKRVCEEKIPPPSLSELDKTYSEMRSLFHEKQLELERVMEEHTYSELEPNLLDSFLKRMEVSLGTLAQLISSFCHSYEAEIQPWTGHHQHHHHHLPSTSSLGPLCKRVILLKEQMDKLFHALNVLEVSFQQLSKLNTSLLTSEHQDQICTSAYQVLKDCLNVIN